MSRACEYLSSSRTHTDGRTSMLSIRLPPCNGTTPSPRITALIPADSKSPRITWASPIPCAVYSFFKFAMNCVPLLLIELLNSQTVETLRLQTLKTITKRLQLINIHIPPTNPLESLIQRQKEATDLDRLKPNVKGSPRQVQQEHRGTPRHSLRLELIGTNQTDREKVIN